MRKPGPHEPTPKVDRPLRRHLRDDEEAALVARVWQRLDDRAPSPRRWVAASAWGVLLVAGVLVAGIVRQRVGGRQPLTLAAGEPLGLLEAAATQPARLPLSDGSEILLAPGSRLKTLQNGNGVVELALERGRAELEVRPGGRRRWVIDADLLSVEVVGTHFTVAREADGDAVTVTRGIVLVRGERVPDHVQKLAAGQALRVDASPSPSPSAPPSAVSSSPLSSSPSSSAMRPAASSPASSSVARPAASASSSSVPRPSTPSSPFVARPSAPSSPSVPGPSAPSSSAPQASASSAAPSETHSARSVASAAVVPTGGSLPALAPSPTQLLDEVDALRRAGRLDQATAMLQRLAFDGARSPTAAIAAFTLGRLLLDAPADPARATRAFERALHLGLPAGLSADAVALCREALARGSHGSASVEIPHDRCR